MKPNRRFGFAAACILLALGCSETNDPISAPTDVDPRSKAASGATTTSTSEVLSGFEVVYDGRTFDSGANQTTFSYTVRSSGAQHALSNFVLQLPDCAPALAGSSPAGGTVGTDPNSGLFGIKWNLTIDPSDTVGRSFSVTYPGDIVEGVVRVAVKASTILELGVLPGACGGFDIGGVVFIDRDADGSRDAVNEPGVVANVTVTLVDPDGSEQTQKTDASGQYLFRRQEGTYTLRLDLITPDTDFNEELGESFAATTALTATVTVGPDASDNNFGFDPQTQKIKDEINTGVLFTNGQDAKFWTQEVRTAAKGRGNSTFDAATMLALLNAVEGLFFDTPYQFTDGAEFQEALAILSSNPRTALDELIKELLVTELNHVAGFGLANDLDFQAVLISWGESWVRNRLAAANEISPLRRQSDDPELSDVTEVFGAINQRGGGDAPDPGTGG